MKILFFVLVMILGLGAAQAADWYLDKSNIGYVVTHPLHRVEGASSAAKGKGSCDKAGCQFLVAAPLTSFDSHNASRDSHVMQTVGAGAHPFVSVMLRSKSDAFGKATPMAAEIELNGVKVKHDVQVDVEKRDSIAHASGVLHLKLTDFKIERPSLLGVAVKDDFEVSFDSQWQSK